MRRLSLSQASFIAPLGVVLLACSLAAAQQTPAPPTFDVVSIKPSNPGGRRGWQTRVLRGRWGLWGGTVDMLVYLAYGIGLGPNRILGLPSWNDKTRFDIEAETAAATVPKPQFEAMLQAILRDRFHFVANVESRPMRAYVITAPAGDGKLQPPTGDCVPYGAPWSIGALYCGALGSESVGSLAGALALGTPDAKGLTHLRARWITVADLADFLPRGIALPEDPLPVADETGIVRQFDLDLAYKFSRPRRDQGRDQYDSDVDANFREFRKALLEQTGLALSARPTKAPLPVAAVAPFALRAKSTRRAAKVRRAARPR